MTSSDPDALRAQVHDLLQRSTLVGVAFHELSMSRKSSVVLPEQGAQYPVEVSLGHQETDDGAAYLIGVGVERPDLAVSVSTVVVYHCTTPEAFQDPEVARLFGELVALPAGYPYARAKVQEITIDTGVAPVVLGILDMTRPSDAFEDDGQPPVGAGDDGASFNSDA